MRQIHDLIILVQFQFLVLLQIKTCNKLLLNLLNFYSLHLMKIFSYYTQRHAYHLVDPSILPFLTSISALSLTLGSVLFFHGYTGGLESTLFGLFGVLSCMFL